MLIPLRIKAFDREGGHGDEAEQLVLLDRAEMAVPLGSYRSRPMLSINRGFSAPVIVDFVREERSEEHTSELQSLMRNSYAVFGLQKKQHQSQTQTAHLIL